MRAYSSISGWLVRARVTAHAWDPTRIRRNSPNSDNARSIGQELIAGVGGNGETIEKRYVQQSRRMSLRAGLFEDNRKVQKSRSAEFINA